MRDSSLDILAAGELPLRFAWLFDRVHDANQIVGIPLVACAHPANGGEDFREPQERTRPRQNRQRVSLSGTDVGVEVEAGRFVTFQRERTEPVFVDQKSHHPVAEHGKLVRLASGRTKCHHLPIPSPVRQRCQIIERCVEVQPQRRRLFGDLGGHKGVCRHIHEVER